MRFRASKPSLARSLAASALLVPVVFAEPAAARDYSLHMIARVAPGCSASSTVPGPVVTRIEDGVEIALHDGGRFRVVCNVPYAVDFARSKRRAHAVKALAIADAEPVVDLVVSGQAPDGRLDGRCAQGGAGEPEHVCEAPGGPHVGAHAGRLQVAVARTPALARDFPEGIEQVAEAVEAAARNPAAGLPVAVRMTVTARH